MSVIPEGFRYEPQWFSRVIPKLFQIELSGLINLPQGTLMPPNGFSAIFVGFSRSILFLNLHKCCVNKYQYPRYVTQ